MVVHYLIDFEARLAQVEVATKEQTAKIIRQVAENSDGLRKELAKASEATELFRLLEASAVSTRMMAKLVRHASLIDSRLEPLACRFARSEIDGLSQFLKELGEEGIVVYEGEDRDWLLTLTREADASIDAVSLTTVDASGNSWIDGGFWTSDLGQRYLEAQREAIGQRKVRVRRVFILHGEDGLLRDVGLSSVCQQQQEIGVEARILDPASTPERLKGSFFDLVIFDGVVSYEMTPASLIDDKVHPRILNTRLEFRPNRVAMRSRYFQDLWEAASPFPRPRQSSEEHILDSP